MPPVTQNVAIARLVIAAEATIPAGQTTSSIVDARGYSYGGVQLPLEFTGANLSFSVSVDGSTFAPLRGSASDEAVLLAVTPGNAYPLPPEVFCFPAFKLVAVSAQGADRAIAVVLNG